MKRAMIKVAARVFCWLGIVAIFYLLNRKAKRILTFHSVMPDEMFNGGTTMLSDSATSFRRKIIALKKRWRFSVDLNDPSTLTLTFDDGFKNEVEIAGKILKEEGDIPAVLFVVTSLVGLLDPRRSLVVDLLMHWNACVPDGEYSLSAFEKKIKYTGDNRHVVWCDILRPLYASDGENKGRKLLRACDEAYPFEDIFRRFSQEYLRLRLCGVSQDDIDEVEKRGWLIGSHSRSHYVFSSLDKAEKHDELEAPEKYRKTVFSYPYGETKSIDLETIREVEAAGYLGAVCNLPDGGGRAGRYFIPRMTVPEDPYLMHFELSGLKTFLKTGRLLPVIRI